MELNRLDETAVILKGGLAQCRCEIRKFTEFRLECLKMILRKFFVGP